MPNADFQLEGDLNLTPKLSDKQLSLGLRSFSKKSSDILSQNLTKRFLKMIAEGEARTGIGARTAFLRRQGISGSKLNEGAWTILDQAQTRAENIRTGYQKLMRQQKIDEERLLKQQKDQETKEQADTLWRARYKALSPITRIKNKLGSTADYKSVRQGLETELLNMQENGATQKQYDFWKRKVESAYNLGESQLKYNTELEQQAKKTGDKSLLSEKTYKKFQTKELKGIDKLNKTAKENNVKISGTSAGSSILSKLLGALSVQRVASYIWGAGKRGETQAVDEFASEVIYGGSKFNTLSRALEWQGISKGTSQQFLGSVADFAESEKWGRVSGEQYNALGALSRASGADVLSMMRRNDSEGIMQAIRRIRSSGSLSADALRNYLRMAGWSEEMMVANAPELFPEGNEVAGIYQSSAKVTNVNRRNALQNRRTNLIKNKNYNYMASGLNDIFTALSPFTWGDWTTRGKEPGYLQDGIKIENNISVDAKGNSNADEIANKVADRTGESTKSSMNDVANMITNNIMGRAE